MSLLSGTTAAPAPASAAPSSSATSLLPTASAVEEKGWILTQLEKGWDFYWGLPSSCPFGTQWIVKLVLVGLFLAAIGFTLYMLYKNAKEILAFAWGLLTKLAAWAVEALKNALALAAALWALVCFWVFGPFKGFGHFGWTAFLFFSVCLIAAGLVQWRFKPWTGNYAFKAATIIHVMSAVFILFQLGAPELMQAIRGSSEVTYFRIVNAASTSKDVKLAEARKNALLKLYDRNRDTLLAAMQQPTLTIEAAQLIGQDLQFEIADSANLKKEMNDVLALGPTSAEGEAQLAALKSKLELSEGNIALYRRMLADPTIDESLLKDLELMIQNLEERKAIALKSFEAPTIAAAENEIHNLIEERDRLTRRMGSGLEENSEANRKKLAKLSDQIAEKNTEIERTNRSLGRGFASGPFTMATIAAVIFSLIFAYLFFKAKTVGGKVAVLFFVGPLVAGGWMTLHFLKQGAPWSTPRVPAPARSNVSDASDHNGDGRQVSHVSKPKSGGAVLHQAEGQGYETAAIGPRPVEEPITITATGPFTVYMYDPSTVHWAADGKDIGSIPDYYVSGVGRMDPQRSVVLTGRPGQVPAEVSGRDVAAEDSYSFRSHHKGFAYFVRAEKGVTITVRRSS